MLLKSKKIHKLLKGTVVKKSGNKTIKVRFHYMKYFSKIKIKKLMYSNLLVHDEYNKANIGEEVFYKACAPKSKDKAFILEKKY